MNESPLRRVLPGLLLLSFTLFTGTLGFMLTEGWSVIDALFATVLIVSTLGFGMIQPTLVASKLLTIALIAGGVGTLYYLLGSMAQGLIESQIGIRRERRLKQQIERLKDHIIVCGYGRVGQEVVRELRRESRPFVIIEHEERRVQQMLNDGLLVYQGDASADDVLRAVGIERAQGMVVCTGSDAENVFITLTARSLNDKLFIVARSVHEDDEPKLLRAGANRAITPSSLGGRRMVGLVLRPAVVEFLDVLTQNEDLQMWLEEIRVDQHAEILSRPIRDLNKLYHSQVMVLAIKRANGKLISNPAPDTVLKPGDILIALGTRAALTRLEELSE